MPAQPKHGLPAFIGRRAAVATAAVTALAIAAPLATASAATPRAVVQTPAGTAGSAVGPTLVGDTFNGATVIVTSPSSAIGTVNDSR
jgi:hypothetical protein